MADLIHYDRTANRLRNAIMNYIASNKTYTLPTIPDTGRVLDLLEKYYIYIYKRVNNCVEKDVSVRFVQSSKTVCTRKKGLLF